MTAQHQASVQEESPFTLLMWTKVARDIAQITSMCHFSH